MLTVLHVITGLGYGGAERMVHRIATAAQQAGDIRTVVVSLTGEGAYGAALRHAGVEVHTLDMRLRLPSPLKIAKLASIVRWSRPDVAMTWLYHADLLGLAAARLAGGVPVVWNLRCSDMDFSRYAWTTRAVVSLLTRLSGRPFAIGYNSEAGREAHAALGYRPKRWRALPNGFDLNVWRPDPADRETVRREWAVADEDVVAALVARIDPQKDHETFLAAAVRAASRAPQLRFVLIGSGTEALTIPPEIGERTIALGARSDVDRLLRGCDLAVSSSAYGEGLPNAIGEAMATALPCVATDVGDSARLIGDTGRVVPPRDAGALADALADLAARPPRERMSLGDAAQRRLIAGYALSASLAAYRSVWEEAAHQARRPIGGAAAGTGGSAGSP